MKPETNLDKQERSFDQKVISVFAICILFIVMLNSCFLHYYKTNSTNHVDAATMQQLIYSTKYYILHENNTGNAFAFTNLKVNDRSVEGILDTLGDEHSKYLEPKGAAGNRFEAKFKSSVLSEIHFYADVSGSLGSHVEIPYNAFTRMDVYTLDKGRTTRSAILSAAGITLLTAGIVGVIVASTQHNNDNSSPPPQTSTGSSSIETCSPQVYTVNHNRTELNGALCSGAIYASLERTDYLPIIAENESRNKLNLIMKGEKNEELMMKGLQLIQVIHRKNENVLIDKYGKTLTYKTTVAPSFAGTVEGIDVLPEIISRDQSYYSFTNENENRAGDIILGFEKPVGALSGKLIINAKNSNWGYYVFGQFKKLYGDAYQSMIQKKDKANPAKVLQCEIDQNLPLLVYVRSDSGWRFADYFFTPGNVASRDMIMQIDLKDVANANNVQIRLQTAYMFWDLDYAGMDFSANDSCNVSYLIPSGFTKTNTSSSYTQKISGETGNSYVPVNDNEQLSIEFDIAKNPDENSSCSYFLSGNGYYHDKTQFEGKPRLAELVKFSGKNAFDKFSREKFEMALTAFGRASEKQKTISPNNFIQQ